MYRTAVSTLCVKKAVPFVELIEKKQSKRWPGWVETLWPLRFTYAGGMRRSDWPDRL